MSKNKRNSSGKDWMWLFLFFGALWLAGYILYTYKPEEVMEKIKKPFEQLAERIQRLVEEPILEPAALPPVPAPPVPEVPKPAESIAPPTPPVPLSSLDLGKQFFDKGDLEQALLYFNQSVGESPNQKDVYLYLGKISVLKKRNQEAVKFFNQSLALSPNDSESEAGKATALFNLALEAETKGEWEEAFEYLKNSKKFYPEAAAWETASARILPLAKARMIPEYFLIALESYKKANQLFLEGWAYELPNSDAKSLFLKAEKEFLKGRDLLTDKAELVPPRMAGSMSAAFEERLKSLKIATKLAEVVPANSAFQWEVNLQALSLSNQRIREAVDEFSNYLSSVETILTAEELEAIRAKLQMNTKGVLVTLQKRN